MPDLDTIARIQIEATADGVDESTAKLNQLTDAQARLATASEATATVTDTTATRSLSAQTAYDSLARRIDSTYASAQQYAKGQGVLQAALNQGIIDSGTYAKNLEQLGAKYGVVTEEAAKQPGVFRSITDALGLTSSASGSAAKAAEELAAGHHEANEATTAFKEGLHTLHPVIGAAGLSLGEFGKLTGAARAGIVALSIAVTGVLAIALAEAGDEAVKAGQRFGELLGGSEAGKKAFEELEESATNVSVSVAKLTSPFETLTKAIRELQSQGGAKILNQGDLDATSRIAAGAIDTLNNFMRADRLTGDEAAKTTAQIIDALSKRSTTIKEHLSTGETVTSTKQAALTPDTFEKIRSASPQLADAIAHAFNAKSVEQFEQRLQQVPISTAAVLNTLLKLGPAAKDAFDASQKSAKTFSDAIDNLKVNAEGVWKAFAKDPGVINFINEVGDAFKQLAEQIKTNGFAGQIQFSLNELQTTIAAGLTSVGAFFKSVWTDATTWASDKLGWLKGVIGGWVQPVISLFQSLPTPIKDIWTSITTWASDKLVWLKDTIVAWAQPVLTPFVNLGNSIKAIWTDLVTWIQAKLQALSDWIPGWAKTVASVVGYPLAGVAGGVGDAVSNATQPSAVFGPSGGAADQTQQQIAQNTQQDAQSNKQAADQLDNTLPQLVDASGQTNEDINKMLDAEAKASAANAAGHANTAGAVKSAAGQISSAVRQGIDTAFAFSGGAGGDNQAAPSGFSSDNTTIGGNVLVYNTPFGPMVLLGGGAMSGVANFPSYPFLSGYNQKTGEPGYVDQYGNPEVQTFGTPPSGVSANTAYGTIQDILSAAASSSSSSGSAPSLLSSLYLSQSGWSGLGLGASTQVAANPFNAVGVPGPAYLTNSTSQGLQVASGAAGTWTVNGATYSHSFFSGAVGPVYDASGLPIYFTPGSGNATLPPIPATPKAPTWTVNGATYSNSYFPGAIGPVYDSQGIPYYYTPGGGSTTSAASAASGIASPGSAGSGVAGLTGLYVVANGAGASAGSVAAGGGISGGGVPRPGLVTFHAATGADFTVPGAGAADSVQLAGWVSPGEHVRITGGANDNGRPLPQVVQSQPIYIPVTVVTNDKRSFVNSEAQVAESIARAVYAAGLKR